MANEREFESTSARATTLERSSDRELVISRTFDGPASLVFDAWTQPDLLKRWWAPRSLGVTMFECEVDLRVGGKYRFVFGRNPTERMAFSGTYTEIVSGARFVCTQIFEPMPAAGESIITASFNARGGSTDLVLRQLYASKASLDGTLAGGMERGMRETYDQLDALVADIAK